MLFIATMFFAVSASAATLTLTGTGVNTGVGSTVSATGGSATGLYNQSWGLSTGADTNALFKISFFDQQVLGLTTVAASSYNLIENGTTVATIVAPITATGFSFSYLLLQGAVYALEVSGNVLVDPTAILVSINAVPVPAALFLFAPALLGLFGLRRRATLAA